MIGVVTSEWIVSYQTGAAQSIVDQYESLLNYHDIVNSSIFVANPMHKSEKISNH